MATLPHFDEAAAVAKTATSSISHGMNNDNDEDMDDGEVESRSIEAVGFCPSNIPGVANWCATGGVDGILKIWNMNVSGAQLRQRCVCTTSTAEEGGEQEQVQAGILHDWYGIHHYH